MAMNDLGLDGSVAIVTGAGSLAPGIGNGKAAAVLLAEAGAKVMLVDRSLDNMKETLELIAERGGDCVPVTADVSDEAGCAGVVASAMDTWGRVDVLVNNVGTAGPAGTVVDVAVDAWDACLRVNVTSMLLMSRFAIPHMRAAGAGSIVNISSVLGMRGGHPAIAYPTTKAAIIGLTKSMAVHHGPDGIRVNAVAPGFAYTPMVYAQGLSEENRERRRLAAPLHTEGTGWDTGEAVLFLASDRSRWMTGTVLVVDGGLTASAGMTGDMSVTARDTP
jgi:NAD(P)-dependent dehydrogenase (short-subunit alcohol dehydrogenase family)